MEDLGLGMGMDLGVVARGSVRLQYEPDKHAAKWVGGFDSTVQVKPEEPENATRILDPFRFRVRVCPLPEIIL